jgi:hypothetical protein
MTEVPPEDRRNAWAVEFRFPKHRLKASREWVAGSTVPAVDIIEYEGLTPTPNDGDSFFDIGQGRAHVEEDRLQRTYGSDIETRVVFVSVKPWWLKDGEEPTKEFTLKAKYASRI